MSLAAKNLQVSLGERSYDILIGKALLQERSVFAPAIKASHVIIVSNETIAPLYLETLRQTLSDYTQTIHLLADGESFKNMDAMLGIVDAALKDRAARDCVFVALGGGVVGDITGFAAATFMRGVDFIQVPTTLLAQVDSSVGGKTGVNHPSGKNLLGAFHQPVRVIIDTETLSTLPPREFSAGMAEVIKYGAISDVDFFDWLEDNMTALMERDSAALTEAIYRSCASKASTVAADERERGQRALLNFGHTFGHAIETCTGYTRWLHGEAVAMGMLMAARMSRLEPAALTRLSDVLAAADLPAAHPDIPAADLLKAMGHDKKVERGRIRLILLRTLGDAYVSDDYDDDDLKAVLAGEL
ncbi:MAG: 3-dehydroquinate synthase [Woeseiaceae bacterium]